MSKVSYSLIDDDHIDDQETINVGNLIIDLESVLEKEKIENEQQANNTNNANSQSVSTTPATTCTTTMFNNNNKSQPSTTTSIETKPSSSINNKNSSNNTKLNSHQKTHSADKLSISSNTNNNNNLINMNNSSVNTNNNNNSNCNNINDGLTTKSLYKSGGEIKMRIARETKAGKSEHKIVSSPNQKSPTSSSGTVSINVLNNSNIASTTAHIATNNNNNKNNIGTSSSGNHNHHQHNKISSDDNILEPTQSFSSISSTKECGTSTSIGTITEPECLGPCEPGTSVTLEGIVWQETEGGILVVNVTWRGKTYVGALLDCTKHDWAPPRLCDSPASDIDSKTHKGVRTKRIVTRSNGIGLDDKNLLQTTGKLRNGKGRRILTANDLAPCNKRQRESDKTNENIAVPTEIKTSTANVSSITNSDNACVPVSIDTTPTNNNNEQITTTDTLSSRTGPNSPMLIGCAEPNCSKKYRNMNGLLYHQAHAHGNNNDNSSNPKDKIESPTESIDLIENEEKPSQVIEAPKHDSCMELNNEQNSNSIKQKNDENLQEKPVKITTPKLDTRNKQSTTVTTPTVTASTVTTSVPTLENNNSISVINQPMDQPPSIIRFHESEKRSSSSSNHDITNSSHAHRKSPTIDNCNSNVTKHKHQSNNPPAPAPHPPQLSTNMEEGMKPSGTSTGPPPAPHQANCFFNSPYMAGVPYNPFGMNPYLARAPTLPPPMYDQLTQPATSNAIFKLMTSMRVPPLPESPSRLLSPSVPKNLPFPPFKIEPGQHVPTSSPMTNPPIPNMPPMLNSHIGGGSPHPRMPGQMDPMLPPGLPPYPPPPMMNVPPNPVNPLSRPPVPNLLDDHLSKQYPRRFN